MGRQGGRPRPDSLNPLPRLCRHRPAWTAGVVNDPDRLVDELDPRSAHANSVRIIGYSPTAQMVITVVALRNARGVLRGASAWKTSGAPLRQYLEDRSDD